jgi:hypothetical protein
MRTGRSAGSERRYDVSDKNAPAKIKETLEDAKQAVDKRDDQIEHAAEKVEPYLHEARERVHNAATKDR